MGVSISACDSGAGNVEISKQTDSVIVSNPKNKAFSVDLEDSLFKTPPHYTSNYTSGVLSVSGSPKTPSPFGKTGGISFVLENSIIQNYRGRTISVEMTARSSNFEKVLVIYSTDGMGNSGWNEFDLSPDFKNFTFDYLVPDSNVASSHYIGVAPQGKNVNIRGIWIYCALCAD